MNRTVGIAPTVVAEDGGGSEGGVGEGGGEDERTAPGL